MEILERHSSWFLARVPCWWSGYQDLPYVNEPFNDESSVSYWQSLGYTQTKFTGDMYDMRQLEPGWIEPFRKHLPWQHFSWSVYRMEPGTVLPVHGDTYARFLRIHNINDIDRIWRAIVFLEDWQSGHYLEIQDQPIVGWQAGDVVAWQSTTRHLAANMGTTIRYTLQITGVPNAHPLT